jgi:hypothetical protein
MEGSYIESENVFSSSQYTNASLRFLHPLLLLIFHTFIQTYYSHI